MSACYMYLAQRFFSLSLGAVVPNPFGVDFYSLRKYILLLFFHVSHSFAIVFYYIATSHHQIQVGYKQRKVQSQIKKRREAKTTKEEERLT